MSPRREVILSAVCALLVACSAAASAPNDSLDATVSGVGVLPGSNPDSQVVETDAPTVPEVASTTTVAPQPQIGTLVSGNKLLMIGDSITASAGLAVHGAMMAFESSHVGVRLSGGVIEYSPCQIARALRRAVRPAPVRGRAWGELF